MLLRLHQQNVVRRRTGRRRSAQVDRLERRRRRESRRRRKGAGKVDAVKVDGGIAAPSARLALVRNRS